MFLHIKRHYFIHFCCLFLQLMKAFSVSLNQAGLRSNSVKNRSRNESTLPDFTWKNNRYNYREFPFTDISGVDVQPGNN